LNASLAADNASLALSAAELKYVDNFAAKLEDKIGYQTTTFTEVQYAVLDKMLKWPSEMLGPVLHLVRMLCLHPHAAQTFAQRPVDKDGDIVAQVCNAATQSKKDTVSLLALRALCNFFSRRVLVKALAPRYELLSETAFVLLKRADGSKDLKNAAAGILMNYAILFQENAQTHSEGKIYCLNNVIEALGVESTITDADLTYRLLVVLGSLIFRDANTSDMAAVLDTPALVKKLGAAHSKDKNVSDTVAEILKALESQTTPTAK